MCNRESCSSMASNCCGSDVRLADGESILTRAQVKSIGLGRNAMVEMEATGPDGKTVPNGFRYETVAVSDPDLVSERNMEWTCEDDSDDDPLEIVVDIRTLAELISKAAKWDALVAEQAGN